MTVENNEFLEDMQIIKVIKECIKIMAEYSINDNRFELQLHDSNSYLILKITTQKQNNQYPLLPLKISNIIRKADIITNEKNEIELRVLFLSAQ